MLTQKYQTAVPVEVAILAHWKVLEYRLQYPSRIYRRGQDAIARIRYQQFGQSEQVVQSNPEAVAFMIP